MATQVSCKKQVPELKIVQSLAFLAVVLQSALSYTIKQPAVAPEQGVLIGMFFNLAKFSAPAFIFIVGFTLIYHHEKQVRYQSYIFEKVAELIVPYLFWSLIYLTMNHQLHMGEAVQAILLGSAAPHMWYVVMMFQIHLLFPVLFALFHWFRRRVNTRVALYKMLLVFGLLYAGLMWFSAHYVFNGTVLTHTNWLLYTDRTFLFYSFYFVMGGIAAAALPAWRKFVFRHVPVNTFVFLTLFFMVSYELFSFDGLHDIHLQVSTYLKPSMFLYTTSEILLMYALAMTIVHSRTFLYKLLQFVGRFTYGAYLAHLFFLPAGVKLLAVLGVPANSLLYALLLFSLTAVLSIGTISLLTLVPFAGAITGPTAKLKLNLSALSVWPVKMKKQL
ncbi:acyltransferase [Ectobacillus ponti]|uniref:Acyltransferase n=1 Tax=Ectobacillus ponti TaxID=2961894 RepID=A0AA41X5S3_9BACI|nr:acyltransferase [Ectobacillus ponti]MCP8967683.1 acyltransferase [Ectobacillus ponti]